MEETDTTLNAATPADKLSKAELLKSLAKLIVHWPLYRKLTFAGDFRQQKTLRPPVYQLELPKMIRTCCLYCAHPQPWDVSGFGKGKIDTGFNRVQYSCRACRRKQDYWLLVAFDENGGSIIKTGQFPPLELEPPPLIAAGMEKDDLRLYRHALTCRHSNFGIAAVAYLRRIVENRTNFLIDLIAARLQEEDPASPLLQDVAEIKKDRRFSEKITFAADLIPKSVRLGGHNPISALHDLTSEALHGFSDDESVDVFDRCQLAFEHVIKRLKQDQDEDQDFQDALKKLTEKSGKKPSKK